MDTGQPENKGLVISRPILRSSVSGSAIDSSNSVSSSLNQNNGLQASPARGAYKEWLQRQVAVHISQYWEMFFEKWIQALIRAFNHPSVRDFLSMLENIYDKANKPQSQGIKVGESSPKDIIWIFPNQLADSSTAHLLSKNMRDNHSLILAMELDVEKLAEYIIEANNIAVHLEKCLPSIIQAFISAASQSRTKEDAMHFQVIKTLFEAANGPDSWKGFVVSKKKDVVVYYAHDSVTVEFQENIITCNVDTDKNGLAQFVISIMPFAPHFCMELPTTVEGLHEALKLSNE